MTYIKRVVMQGFKSFARKTEIPLENSMNVIVGPNGSGKSNITDALCFVLGRLSIKSIRAAKAANLLFSGNKIYKASPEASIEMVFDNTDNTFSIDSSELTIKRIVRRNGQSIYKINDHVKTRQELLELLAQAGIDPNGFNIVLQGEIQSLVKATPEERRKIIEEVAGISIYETRKHKSLLELDKTDEKLKEVSAVLKERNSYLKNLDKERQEALSHQKLEEMIKRCKATLLSKDLKEKEKVLSGVDKVIGEIEKEVEKNKKEVVRKNIGLEELQEKISTINNRIQSSTSNEQEGLHKEISDLKADVAGLSVRQENFENRIVSGRDGIRNNREKVEILENEIKKIRVSSPEIAKQQEQQRFLQKKVDDLEQQRRRFYRIKSEVSTLENQKIEKEKFIIESKKEISLIEQGIESLYREIKYGKSVEAIIKIKMGAKEKVKEIENQISLFEAEILKLEKENAVYEKEIEGEEKLRGNISNLKVCFICKQVVSEDHKHKISSDAEEKIMAAKVGLRENGGKIEENRRKIEVIVKNHRELQTKINELEIDRMKIENSEEKKNQIIRLSRAQKEASHELALINERFHAARESFEKLKGAEGDYDETRLRLQELSFADMDVDAEISMKKREVNRLNVDIKTTTRDVEDSEVELKKIITLVNGKKALLEKREKEEEELYNKFQKLFEEKTELQDKQKVIETDIMGFQHVIRGFEDKVNENKIRKAQFSAQMDALKTELNEFGSFEEINIPVDKIRERLQEAQFRISKLGNVNMRALEAFEKVEEQCRLISERVSMIEGEKEKVLKIILEIDKKKKKSFLTTLEAVNEYFTRNFSQLSNKGTVFLELENKKDPFAGGINILIKVARGKYFDVTSLSGGEKTLVALSLIFAIQEYRPYCFYVLDEIDAALDKHNSELLAALIKKYMTAGQYIIITHNDTLISEATNLYGVSMQENISKIVSLKV
ncbi:MAG: chromosome segregation protein SMC [archaeon]|nr:chromosome segregation protein SMC [archaeon]MCR4323754.1 chromosome segregation protein SMC [Nanoarchaeota archaeon]